MPLALPPQARNIGVYFLLFYSHLPQSIVCLVLTPSSSYQQFSTSSALSSVTHKQLRVHQLPLLLSHILHQALKLSLYFSSFFISLTETLRILLPPPTQVCKGCPHHPEIQFF